MFNIQFGDEKFVWSKQEVQKKLEAIGQLKDKKVSWIRSDLSTANSTLISRLIWTFFAKYFNCLRESLFKVNLEKSKSLLQQIGENLDKTDEPLITIYNSAAEKFNAIAPHHMVLIVALPVIGEEAKNTDEKKGTEPPMTQQAEEGPFPPENKTKKDHSLTRDHHNEKGKINKDHIQQDFGTRKEKKFDGKINSDKAPDSIPDPIPVPEDAESANQFLATTMKEGAVIDPKDSYKFQNARELDLSSVKFPLPKASLETIFAKCVIENVILPGTIDLEGAGQEEQKGIDDLGFELNALETFRFLLNQNSKKTIDSFRIVDFSAESYALLLAKLPKDERTGLVKLFQQQRTLQNEEAFLIEAIKLKQTELLKSLLTVNKLDILVDTAAQQLEVFRALCETLKSKWKDTNGPDQYFGEFDILMQRVYSQARWQWKKREELLNIVFERDAEDNFDLLTIMSEYAMTQKKAAGLLDGLQNFSVRLQLSFVQIMKVIRSDELDDTEKNEKFLIWCDMLEGSRGFEELAAGLGSVCTPKEVSQIFRMFLCLEDTKLSSKAMISFMSGILWANDQETIRSAFENLWNIEGTIFTSKNKLSMILDIVGFIDSKMQLEEAANTFREHFLTIPNIGVLYGDQYIAYLSLSNLHLEDTKEILDGLRDEVKKMRIATHLANK